MIVIINIFVREVVMLTETSKEWNDKNLSNEFDKQSKEWSKKQTIKPTRGVKIADGGIQIDPYNLSTIVNYLDNQSEKEFNFRIEILLTHLITEWNELEITKIIDFVSGKYGLKKKVLEQMLDRLKKNKKEESIENEKKFKINQGIQLFNEDYIELTEQFWEIQPFYYDKSGLWWLWNFDLNCWEMVDEIDLFNTLRDNISQNINITKGNVFAQITKAMQLIGRTKKPKDAPEKWIQFKDQAFSIKSGKIYEVTKEYFFTNPIPWEIGVSDETPTLDKLFKEWVGEKYVSTLYEILAYCCYSDYPIQTFFCLYGGGRNGKSCFLKILAKFIGTENLCSTDLDLLVGNNKSRFEIFKLYRKLACLMGETNFGILQSSAILKKLTGGDLIGFEYKNKAPFDDYNYAKVLIATNTLPTSEDTSEGFYRRWVIIDFPNDFPEGKDITKTIPDIEYNNLANKCCKILPKLLEEGKFTNQGTIEERKNRYVMASNPLPFFIDTYCYENPNLYIRYSEMFLRYVKFLNFMKKRVISKKEFSKKLNEEGYDNRRTSKEGEIDYYIEGIGWNRKKFD